MRSQLIFWRILLGITIAIIIIAILQIIPIAAENGIALLHSNWTYFWVLPLAVFIALLTLSWSKFGERLVNMVDALTKAIFFWRLVAFLVFIGALPIFSFLILYPYYLDIAQSSSVQVASALRIFSAAVYNPFVRALIFWLVTLLGIISLKVSRKDFSWPFSLVVSAIAQAAAYSLVTNFSLVNNYPFSLGWSETTNYYRASILFASQIYGMNLALPSMHATLNFMLAVPFLLGNLPIWMHRAWYAILLVGFTIALGFVFVRRLKLSDRRSFWLLVAWALLFLMQGPVHIHLLACAFIFLWGVKPQKFWRTTLVIMLASVWAGMSRINWYPVPGLFAAALYLLEVPYEVSRPRLRYLWKPVFWFTLGLIAALASQFTYVLVSGNANQPGGAFTSLTSDLLWYRLFPNPTYPRGVLLDLLLVSVPLILIIALVLRQGRGAFHPVRLAGIFGILLVLCAGGVMVSTKIGGGSDLHNLDAYLIFLMLVGGYNYFGLFTPETGKTRPTLVEFPLIRLFLLILAVTVPVWAALQQGRAMFTWDRSQVEKALSVTKSQAEAISAQGGEVLFISQRHLLALKMVDVPLTPAYEQDYLMEMVMSHNQTYLYQFQSDLRQQRFAMIVVGPQNNHLYKRDRGFAEENNLWVLEVSQPLLCYYEMVYPPEAGLDVALYLPRSQPCK